MQPDCLQRWRRVLRSVLGAGVPAGMSTWSAMDFGSFYSQAISFTIVKLTAMAVQHGIRQAMAEAHSSN